MPSGSQHDVPMSVRVHPLDTTVSPGVAVALDNTDPLGGAAFYVIFQFYAVLRRQRRDPSLGKFQPTEARSLHHLPHRWAGGSSWEHGVGPGQPLADLTVGLETHDMWLGQGRPGG